MNDLASLPQRYNLVGNDLVAANVRAQLAYADITQGALAEHLGLSDMALSRRIKANYAAEFSASEIANIAAYFGITPGELFAERPRPADAKSAPAPKSEDANVRTTDYHAVVSDLASHRAKRLSA